MANLQKHKIQFVISLFISLIITVCLTEYINIHHIYHVPPVQQAVLDSIDLKDATKLMIVAHPDDETLWGGAHLCEGGYLVVCITHGNDAVRSSEFYAVMEQSGNQGIMLSYPDKVNGVRDDWKQVESGIYKDLETIIQMKQWDLIVTHNVAGEYGHIHHQKTHTLVKKYYRQTQCAIPLYTFGTYHKKAALADYIDTMTALSSTQLEQKEALLALYQSQSETIQNLSHMNPYEMWTLYQTVS